MKAVVITSRTEPIQLIESAKPLVKEDECLVRIKYASLNRRDQWIREGKYPNIKWDTVLGSDGCGVVEEGSSKWLGKEVVINPNVNWGPNPDAQSDQYSILGMPKNGTLSECISIPADRLVEKPSHLSNETTAALPLAGLTAFRAVFTKGQIAKGQRVLVTGIGGGVAQFAFQFALATGAEVHVTSGDNKKIKKACKQGAIVGFNYNDEDWTRSASKAGGFDVIIDSAGGDLINSYLKLVKPAGKIVMYGSTAGSPQKLDVFRLFWAQAQIMGSTMGNDQEFENMVKFVSTHEIIPTIDKTFLFGDYLSAFDRFKSPDHFGKIVLKID
ncbi:MAG: zinc-binding dehydrogenase [Cytophagales bacterium]|nr:zinc-binding dehydrogenase [Cytophagales bacterium]